LILRQVSLAVRVILAFFCRLWQGRPLGKLPKLQIVDVFAPEPLGF
jgi:hypothetical protein